MNDADHGLDEAFQKYKDMVIRNACLYVNDFHAAEDIAQETFLRLGEHISEVPPEKRGRWLLRVSGNMAKDYRKKGGKYKTIPGLEEWREEADREADNCFDLSVLLERKETRRETAELLRRLAEKNPGWFQTIWMSYFEEMDNRSIAKELGISSILVSQWKRRAKKWLREIYKKDKMDE